MKKTLVSLLVSALSVAGLSTTAFATGNGVIGGVVRGAGEVVEGVAEGVGEVANGVGNTVNNITGGNNDPTTTGTTTQQITPRNDLPNDDMDDTLVTDVTFHNAAGGDTARAARNPSTGVPLAGIAIAAAASLGTAAIAGTRRKK